MNYQLRVILFMLADAFIILLAVLGSYLLLYTTLSSPPAVLWSSFVMLLICHYLLFGYYKLYKKVWEYASIHEFMTITKSVTASIVVLGVIEWIVWGQLPVQLLLITWLLSLMLIGGSRVVWRMAQGVEHNTGQPSKRTLIVGAGSAGTMLARQLLNNQQSELKLVAFIDDDIHKHHLDIMGVPVLGGVSQIAEVAKQQKIDNIVIAIPSISKKQLATIFTECAKTNTVTKTIPKLEDLASGKVSVSHFRDVQVEDLLGREPVELDIDSISGYVTQKVVLVTGAGGSIGSEVCRQVARFLPEKLILLGHGENSIYSIEMELRELFGHTHIEIITEIADLQDAEKMLSVMELHKPHVVYHAAAHKHVPLMERNPEEAFKNNVLGTLNAAKAASANHVQTFVMISTDKAVNPTSVMGATKRAAEMIIQHMDRGSTTRFVAVRFGNVLGSRGSVIPLFKKQIEKGGPITVTHPDMERYFMTIPEASCLVIQAGALARGGEIFVLDMGEPVKIKDLAQNVIRMSGYTVDEIGIKYTGIRPGEKLYEEMLKDGERMDQQVYPKIYIGTPSEIHMDEIERLIHQFSRMSKSELRIQLLAIANHEIKQPSLVSAFG